MTLFHITKEDKIKSARALEKELSRLKSSIPSNVLNMIVSVLEDTARDTDVVIDPSPSQSEYVSPNQAAVMLQASRPYVRKLIDEGVLHAHKIGSHYKIKSSEVYALKESWEPKRKATGEKLNASLDELINESGWED